MDVDVLPARPGNAHKDVRDQPSILGDDLSNDFAGHRPESVDMAVACSRVALAGRGFILVNPKKHLAEKYQSHLFGKFIFSCLPGHGAAFHCDDVQPFLHRLKLLPAFDLSFPACITK